MPDAMVTLPPLDPAALARASLAARPAIPPPARPAARPPPAGGTAAAQPAAAAADAPGRRSAQPRRRPSAGPAAQPRSVAVRAPRRRGPQRDRHAASRPCRTAPASGPSTAVPHGMLTDSAQVAGFLPTHLRRGVRSPARPRPAGHGVPAADRSTSRRRRCRGTPATTVRNKGSSVWAVLVFLVVIAFASGIGPADHRGDQRVVQPMSKPGERRREAQAGTEFGGRAAAACRSFRRLWAAIAVSSLGDWLGLLATTALAAYLTKDSSNLAQGAAVSGVLLTRLLPDLILGPIAGALVDRFDRRKVAIVGDTLAGLLYLSIIFSGNLLWLLVAQFLVEAIGLFSTPAKQAMWVNIVPRERLAVANQLNYVSVYGMVPVAAALFALLSTAASFFGVPDVVGRQHRADQRLHQHPGHRHRAGHRRLHVLLLRLHGASSPVG